MIHLLTAEPKRTTKPKMAKHLLIEVQHEMHLQTDPLARTRALLQMH